MGRENGPLLQQEAAHPNAATTMQGALAMVRRRGADARTNVSNTAHEGLGPLRGLARPQVPAEIDQFIQSQSNGWLGDLLTFTKVVTSSWGQTLRLCLLLVTVGLVLYVLPLDQLVDLAKAVAK